MDRDLVRDGCFCCVQILSGRQRQQGQGEESGQQAVEGKGGARQPAAHLGERARGKVGALALCLPPTETRSCGFRLLPDEVFTVWLASFLHAKSLLD